jgi:paired amphipathic helix protein Sin3a
MVQASAEDMQMLEKIRKFINNKTTYTELLKLMNLFTQDALSPAYALHRISSFVGPNDEIMAWFKNLLGTEDDEDVVIPIHPSNARVSLSRCRALGPSYRLLPRQEINSRCSGRDELCKSVLNDQWVSHPTWESEDSGFVAHKKTIFEETLHRIEEERHDYDSSLEAMGQTISLVEAIVKALEARPPEDRKHYRTDTKLGGRSEFIWKRTIYKLYGRQSGQVVIARLLDNTHVVAPTLLIRLRETRERWRAAQRQWNETWRTQTLQSYHKSLDHQGTNQRSTHDKRQYQPKTLQQEIKARYEDQRDGKAEKILDSFSRDKNGIELRKAIYQYAYTFKNKEVLSDTLHLIFAQFEQKTTVDDPTIGTKLRQFFSLFLSLDPSQFRPGSEEVATPESEASQASENASSKSKASRKSKSLYQAVLDKDKAKSSMPPSASRDGSPDPADGDTAEVEDAPEPQHSSMDTNEQNTWFEVSQNKLVKPNAPEDGKSLSMEDGSPVQESDETRELFPMYCNSVIYCFMRLFGMLYDRLEKLYDHEAEVRKWVDIQLIEKAAHRLFIMDKTPQDYFEDITPDANFYKQVVKKFEVLISAGDSVTQPEVEDLLRRYYLPCGFELYHVDKHVAQMDRLGVMLFGADKDKVSEQLLKLYRQDRLKETITPQETNQYRKQAMKHLGPKEKEGEAAYLFTYVSSQLF